MIAVVQQVPASTAGEDSGARVLAFAAGVRRLRAVRAAVDAALRTLLVLALPWIAFAWLLPQHMLVSALGVLAVTGILAIAAAGRARSVADAVLLRGEPSVAVAGDLAILGDELATWLETQRSAASKQPMATWLGEDVAARLPVIDAPTLQHVGRARLGRLRHLVPAIVLLLLAWLLSIWFQPSWPGLLGGKPEPIVPLVPSQLGTVPSPGEPSVSKPGNQSHRPPPRPEPRNRPDPPTPERPGEPPPDGNQPAPLLKLPEQQNFVVPEHIDDGPTRRMRMHAAELAESGAAQAPPSVVPGAQGEQPPAPPPPSRETFARALEQALRARHVPAEERAMVARFFDLLQKAAK